MSQIDSRCVFFAETCVRFAVHCLDNSIVQVVHFKPNQFDTGSNASRRACTSFAVQACLLAMLHYDPFTNGDNELFRRIVFQTRPYLALLRKLHPLHQSTLKSRTLPAYNVDEEDADVYMSTVDLLTRQLNFTAEDYVEYSGLLHDDHEAGLPSLFKVVRQIFDTATAGHKPFYFVLTTNDGYSRAYFSKFEQNGEQDCYLYDSHRATCGFFRPEHRDHDAACVARLGGLANLWATILHFAGPTREQQYTLVQLLTPDLSRVEEAMAQFTTATTSSSTRSTTLRSTTL